MKLYSAKVGQGSGVLFQPLNSKDYTYILTANHNLFEEVENDRGLKEKKILDEINIYVLKNDGEVLINFELVINENYFPHKVADIAILKLEFQEGYENIYANFSYFDIAETLLCGYPNYLKDKDTLSGKYNSFKIDDFKSENNTLCRAQLADNTAEQTHIIGFSGGGILKIENDYISLIGIQSEVTSHMPKGEIEFVPIKHFDDIRNYPENINKLSPLMPAYMGGFEYLKSEILKLENASQPLMINKIKSAFNEQMKFIGLNPYLIYNSKLGSKLLGDNSSNPFSKKLWVSWLEYLVILCFIEGKMIDLDNIETLFNKKRLVHSETSLGWLEIIPDLLKNNLGDLENDGTLIISTENVPLRKNKRRFKNNVITNIYSAYSSKTAGLLHVDQATKIKSLKEIIHIKAFENDCIMEYEDVFNEISELDIEKIISELKNKLNEFFES